MKPEQLSKTAAFIGIKFYGLTQDHRFAQLFNKETIAFYENIVKYLPAPLRYYHYWLKHRWVRNLYMWSEELLLPGDLLHIIARKWYIRKQVAKLATKGFEQIIVLGAGFDDLAFDFSQKGCSCFEFDVPYMARRKRTFFQDFYPQKNYPAVIDSYLPKNSIGNQIKSYPEINPHKKTIVIAEGFFDYLTKDTVAKTIADIRTYFKHELRLITTHFALNELPFLHRLSFTTGVKTVGEKLQLHHSIDDFKTLLTDYDYSIQTEISHDQMTETLQQKTDTRLSVLKGFYLLVVK